MEKIYIGIYESHGIGSGDVFFISAEHDLGPREQPPDRIRLSFEDVKNQMVERFKARNPKLRVLGMP